MAQSGWRLPDDLLRRVRVRCAETGVRQNVFVERALESALGESPRGPLVDAPVEAGHSAPSRASEPYKLPPSMPSPKPAVPPSRASSKAERVYSCPKAGCIYVASEPGVCVHHRTERLR